MLLVDTLRADHLGAFGFAGAISPHLDGVARESLLFDNCFAQAPWTPPSVGTLFTSLYPQVHGLQRFEDHRFRDPASGELRASVLPDAAVTLAEVLHDAGYDTAGFVANPWLSRDFGLGQGFDVYDDVELSKRTPATMLTVPAGDWLAERSSPAPFFLYLHLMDVHEPYDSSREDFESVRASITDERRLAPGELPPPHMEVPAPWADDEQRASVAYWKARYAAGVHVLDGRLGRFVERLRRSGALDHSWLVVTSDHGEELFDNSGWGHGQNLYDHQLRVPLIVRPPGGLPAARRVEQPVRLIDLMPTLLSLAGVAPPPGLQGTDLAPLLHGASLAEDALPLFATGVVGEPRTFALRTERYKLIADLGTGAAVLYDLTVDTGETLDVSASRPEALARLRERLERHVASTTATLAPRTETVPPRLRERLEALGYVD